MPKRPHVVLFVPDHYRGDVLGHLGNPAAVTPNLDRLVREEAVSFRNAFCQNPVCTPSRCSFMTGWYPHVRGHRTMAHLLHPDEPVLLRVLKEAGYWVWWGGKNDLVAGQLGYERYCDVYHVPCVPPRSREKVKPEREWRGDPGSDTYYSFYRGNIPLAAGEEFFYDSDYAHVLGAVDLIREAPAARPLCIYLSLLFPHLPYEVEEPWYSVIERNKLPPRIPPPRDWSRKPAIMKALFESYNMSGWSEERWTELRATYYGMCARVDHLVGMVVEALRQKGIWDDTLFVFLSDHGDYAGDYGLVDINQNTFEDSLTRVPFIIKPPVGIKVKPGVRDALVELLDLVATVEEVTGVSLNADHYSRSLIPLIRAETDSHRDAVFCEGGRRRGEMQCMELEVSAALNPTGQYWPRLHIQRSNGPEHTKAVMCRTRRFKYVRRLYESDELYDLEEDPQELDSRIDDPDLAQVREEMKERLLIFFLETGDVVPRELDRRSFPYK